jgi:Na+-transporting methylmalonyl-CoA/oxaloacetate decarboxylase beta subunit
MLSDLFSPLLRHQYNTLQWIFPLLLIAAVLKPGKWPVIGLLLAGMLLNIVHIPHVKMQNTMGEYLILLVLLTLSLWPQRDPKAKEALL